MVVYTMLCNDVAVWREYMPKSMGPRTEPCGTPDLLENTVDFSDPTTSGNEGSDPVQCDVIDTEHGASSVSWWTASNAADMSSARSAVHRPWPVALCMSFVTLSSAVSVQ